MKQLTHGSLFAGIGGFDLGFERAGIKTVWQVEIDPFCRKVLERHWPNVQRFEDVRECRGLPEVDVLTGGFPCQDISSAGKRAGIEGPRSGLWKEMWRIICDIRPRFVVVENVAALLGRGVERVLGDLAACRYDAEWQILPAAAFGADHLRERIWIIAYPDGARTESLFECWRKQREEEMGATASHYHSARLPGRMQAGTDGEDEEGISAWTGPTIGPTTPFPGLNGAGAAVLGRGENGIPDRVDRMHALGNAVVPQIAEWIGRRIVEAASE